ncbi:hypothetical protein GCM10027515_11100 [Schumannella luteola]|uniref:Uncharacterized protein n=1 Tax=Schumannella luteola TaxID=472059 RepID=A0A852YIF6_9MICO|nr:hypothetical protein [Schumannella luteola]NYG97559.1 hypothetical protein [Schumannella luteola]TPX01591.1 hypothetical protein FJ656_26830 [Schumannella luteola]
MSFDQIAGAAIAALLVASAIAFLRLAAAKIAEAAWTLIALLARGIWWLLIGWWWAKLRYFVTGSW